MNQGATTVNRLNDKVAWVMAREIGLHFLSMLTTAASRCDSDLKAVLAALQLGLHTRDGQPPFLALPVLAALIEQLEARAHRGRFVFALADVFNFDAQPAVAAFLTSAGSLRQLHRLLDWVPALVHPDLCFEIRDQATEACLYPRVVSADPRLSDHPLLVELMAAAAMHLGRVVAPGVQVVREIEFRHGALGDAALYERYFGCPVRFHGERNTLHGDPRLLDSPLPGSLPQANARAEEAIALQILGDGLAPPLAVEAERLLRQRPALFSRGLTGLADALQLHPRTLQRRLREAGLSYAALSARLRHELACDMLRDSALDIDSIGIKLGFSERRSFTLAFRHWQGQSPSAWRKAARAAGRA